MKRKYISTILLTAAIMMPAGVMAGGDAPAKQTSRPAPSAERHPVDRTADTGAMTFKSFDANKDGFISKDEAKSSNALSRQFAALDMDRDGKLSAPELGGWKTEPQMAGRSILPRLPKGSGPVPGSPEP